MIDFEQEIENRLRHFQWLTGKGNVKDGNHTLYEVIRLMLGMIAHNKSKIDALGKPPIGDNFELFLKNMHENNPPPNDPEIQNDDAEPITITESSAETESESEPSQPTVTDAPLGLTKYGNPKRDRSTHKKKS
jgi:hypothetical protein